MGPRPTAIVPLAAALWLAIGCAAIRTESPPSRSAAAGRVAVVDTTEGFILADFPSGRMMIGLDKREIGHWVSGDEIRIDGFGRPLFY